MSVLSRRTRAGRVGYTCTMRALRLGVSAAGILAAGMALAPASAVDLAGANTTFPGLTGSTTYTNTGGALDLTIDFPGNALFTGTVDDSAGGAIQLIKTGTGNQNLFSANNYRGGTLLQNGILRYGNALSFGTGALTFTGGGVLTPSANGVTIGNAIVLQVDGTVNTGGVNTTLSGVVSGPGQFVKDGTGVVTLLNANNTYTGGTTIQQGGIYVGGDNSLGTGAVTVGPINAILGVANLNSSVTLANAIDLQNQLNVELPNAGQSITLTGAITGTQRFFLKQGGGTLILPNATTNTGNALLASGFFGVGNNASISSGTGQIFASGEGGIAAYAAGLTLANRINAGALFHFDTRGFDLTQAGVIVNRSGFVGSLAKDGAGRLTLSAANTYTGGTTINAGELAISGSTSASSLVTVNSGATLSGTGTANGLVNVNNGAILSPGIGGAGTLRVGSLSLASSAILNFDVGTGGDLVNVTGGLTLDGTLNINPLAGFGAGTYRLINYGAGFANNTLNFGTTPSGFSYTLDTATSGQVNLIVASLADFTYWDGANLAANGAVDGGTGTWNATDTNWTSATGAANGAWSGVTANFGVTPGTVTIVGTKTASQLNFTVGGYVLQGDGIAAPTGLGIDTTTGTTTINSVISGTTVTKTGAGELLLAGANTYTGGTTVSAGALVVGNNASAGAGAISLAGGTTLSAGVDGLNIANNITLAGNATIATGGFLFATPGTISGAGALTKTGSGVLFLAGTNSYAGGTNINGGTIVVYNSNSAGTGTIALADGTQLTTAGGTFTTANAITIAGSGSLLTQGAGDLWTLSGIIADGGAAGTFVKNGSGTVVLSGTNTYSGGTLINGGTLSIGNSANLGAAAGGVTFGGASTLVTTANVTSARAVALNAAGTIDTGANTDTFSGVFSGSGALTKAGSGALTLSGVNTYSGGTTLAAGTIFVTNSGSLGTGALAMANGTVLAAAATTTTPNAINITGTGTVDSAANTLTLGGPVSDGGSAGILLKQGSGTLVLSGTNTYSGGTLLNAGFLQVASDANLGAAAGTLTFNGGGTLVIANGATPFNATRGVIANSNANINTAGTAPATLGGVVSGAGGLLKLGAGTLVLTGANTYSGGTGISDGVLSIDNDGNLGAAGTQVTFLGAGAGVLRFTNGATPVSSNRAVALASNGTLDTTGTADVTLSGVVSGAGSLAKTGTGGLVLSGASTYTGATNVNAGTLTVTGSLANTATTVASGATLAGTGSIGGAVTVASGGNLNPGVGAPGTLTLGGLNLASGSVLNYEFGQADTAGGSLNDRTVVTGALTLDGTINVAQPAGGAFTQGVYNIATYGGALTDNGLGVGTVPGGLTATVGTFDPGYVNLIVSGTGFTQYWDGDAVGNAHNNAIEGGNGTWTATSPNWTTSNGALNANWQGFVGVFQGAAGTVGLTNAFNFEALHFTTSGYVLTDAGGGSLVLNGADVVDTGTVSGGVTVLDVQITGGGSLVKRGSNFLDLIRDNSYSGGTDIQQGIVRAYSNASLGTGTVNMGDGTVLDLVANGQSVGNAIVLNGTDRVRAYQTATLTGVISGTGALISDQFSGGTLVLAGANTYSGGTTLAAGTLGVANNSALGTGGLAMASGTTLQAAAANVMLANAVAITGNGTVDTQANTLTLNGVVSGDSVRKTGTGTLVLNAANTYAAGTFIDQGTVQVGNATALGTGTVTMENATTLRAGAAGLTLANGFVLNGTGIIDTQAFDLTLSGTLAAGEGGGIDKNGTGTLTVSGTGTYSGATNVNAGTLSVTGSLGNTATNVASGASLIGTGSIAGPVTIANGASIGAGVGGTGTLTVGALTLNGTSNVNFELGAANVIGGPLNDRIVVTGNLVLDGLLNVSTSAGGTFGLGIYNLFSYGTVTDNGLTINALPGGFSGIIQDQTAAHQINLIVAAPGTLVQYWDGTDFVGNGSIDGGNGSWTTAATNWTGPAPSALNTNWQPNSIGVFQGAAGNVSVVNDFTFQGLQFSTDGYNLTAGGGSLITNTASFLFVDNGLTTTITAPVTGAGVILKQGAGTLVLGGNNSYAGGTQLQTGTIGVLTDAALGTGQLAMSDGTTLRADAAVTLANAISLSGNDFISTPSFALTLNGVVSGGGTLNKQGGDTLTLNGANTYTGGTNLLAGTIVVGNDSALGTGLLTMSDGTILAAGVSGLTLANAVTTLGGGRVDSGPGVFTLNGNIGGAGSISQIGTGNLVLNGNNSFNGLGINQGTVTVGSNTAAGASFIVINDGAILAAGVSGLVLANTIETTGGGRIDSGPGVFTLNGDISGAGSISQIGTGNLVLNGNNSFNGLGINQGTVTVGTNTAAGASFIVINDGAILAAGVSGLTLANTIQTTGGGRIDSGPGVFTLNGNISGAGSISQIGTGNLVLNGNNSFNGLGINQGTVTVGTNTAAGASFIVINDGAILAAGTSGLVLANAVETTGGGRIDSGPGVFTLNGDISGAGSISQIGTGNLVLNGNNSFNGLGINQGTVTVGTNTAAGASFIAINDGAILAAGVSGLTLTNTIETTGGGRIDSGPGVFTLNGDISGAGSISQIGTGNLVLNGNNSFNGLGINQGTVTVGTNTAAGASFIAINDGGILAAGVSGLVLTNAIQSTGGGRIDSGPGVFTLNGNIAGPGSISQIGTGNLVLNGNNSFNGLGINQGTVTVGSNTAAGASFIVINDGAILAAGVSGLVLANAVETTGGGRIDSGPGVFTLNGDISGAGSISQIGTGNLVLNGNNSFNGLGINQGTVTVGSNTAAGASFIALNDGAILAAGTSGLVLANTLETTGGGRIDSGSGVFTMNGNISGVGSISQIGTGNLVLNGNNSFNGLGINQGTVTVGSNTAAGASFIAINDGAILAAGVSGLTLANAIETTGGGRIDSGPGVFTLNGNISGAGSISQIGTGNLVLNGNNSFTSGLGINQGTVTLGSNTAAGLNFIALNDGGILAAGVSGLVIANNIETTGGGRIDSGAGVFTLNGNISGAGSISQIGTGNLVLNGNNSFTAGLGINQGTVTIGNNSAVGLGFIAINDGGILAAGVSGLVLTNAIQSTGGGRIDSGSGIFTLNGNIAGPGSISQIGTGNLVLNGNNSFVNLGINQGTVTVGTNTAAGVGAIAINDGGILAAGTSGLVLANAIQTTGGGRVDSGPGVFTLNGNISGAGSISQIGTGNLVLNGNNSFAAGLGINQGTVTVGTSTAAGAGFIALNNGGILAAGTSGLVLANALETTGGGRIDSGPGVFTLNGVISGAFSISQIVTGNLVLNGKNTFAAGLGINQGTVTLGSNTAAGTSFIVINDNATLAAGVTGLTVANAIQTTNAGRIDSGTGMFTLTGGISGAGSITKVGSGNLVLTGVSTVTGPTTVAAGRLTVDGSLAASATTVQSGASLAGIGTVGTLTVQSGGTVAPAGAGIGTLSVAGGVTFASGSNFIADLGATGDRLSATGPASLNGTLTLNLVGATFLTSSPYTILSSSARSGTFATVASGNFGNAFLTAVTYDATSVFVRLTPNSLVTLGGAGLTPNQLAVAGAFDAATAGGYNPLPFYSLYGLGAGTAAALSQLSGELHAAERRVALDDTRVVRETAFDRLNAGLEALSGAGVQTASTTNGEAQTTVWLRGAGSWGTANSDGIGSRFETKQAGVLTGIDYATGEWKVGAAFTYIHNDLDLASLGQSKVESTGGALYAGYRVENGLAVGVGGSVAGVSAKGSRSISIPGLGQTLTSNADGTVYQLFGEVAYDLSAAQGTRIEPFARFAYAKYDAKAFSEAGGVAAVSGAKQNYDQSIATAGVRGSFDIGVATLSGSLGYQHIGGDRSPVAVLTIAGVNQPMSIRSVSLDKDAAAIEAQASFRVGKAATLGVGYSGVIGSNNSDHGARATLTVGF